jgi:hypothetical protein
MYEINGAKMAIVISKANEIVIFINAANMK